MTDTDRLSKALHGVEAAQRPGADGVQVLRAAAFRTLSDEAHVDWVTDLGLGLELLFMEDGTLRLAHNCKLVGEDQRERVLLHLNPRTIFTPEPVTITPSIRCDECGLAGWVIRGQWTPA